MELGKIQLIVPGIVTASERMERNFVTKLFEHEWLVAVTNLLGDQKVCLLIETWRLE